MNHAADDQIRARMRRSFDTIAARASATAPGLGRPRRQRRSLAPLGAALGLAVATGVVGAVVLRHPSSHSAGGAVKPPVPATAAPTPSPTVRPVSPQLTGAAVSADLNGGVLVFGGTTTSGTLLDPQPALSNQTWTWNGRWTRLHPGTAPMPRHGAGMVADPARGTVVLFGGDHFVPGAGGADTEFTDTWTWDGSSWTERHPRHHPSTGANPLLTYDVATRQVILLDWDSGTWTWDGTDWTEHVVSWGPDASATRMMAWDPVTRTVVLADTDIVTSTPGSSSACCEVHGNAAADDRTWSWTGSRWVRLHPSTEAGLTSSNAVNAYLATDPSGGMLALLPMGDRAGAAPTRLLRWNGHTWNTAAETGNPVNVDGLVTTSDGRLICIDLSDPNLGGLPVQEWTGGRWIVRG